MSAPTTEEERHEETMKLAVATAQITVLATLLAIGGVGLALLAEPLISGEQDNVLERGIVAVLIIVVLLISHVVLKRILDKAIPSRLK